MQRVYRICNLNRVNDTRPTTKRKKDKLYQEIVTVVETYDTVYYIDERWIADKWSNLDAAGSRVKQETLLISPAE